MGSGAGAISLAWPISLMRQVNQNSIGQNQSSGGRQVAGRPDNRPPPATDCHHSMPESRASMEGMVGSGIEPTYLAVTKTSFAGLLLCCLGPANALEATLITRAIAIAVLVNMGRVSCGVCRSHLIRCVCAFRTRTVAPVNHLEVP